MRLLWDARRSTTPVSADDVGWRIELVSSLADSGLISRAAILFGDGHRTTADILSAELHKTPLRVAAAAFADEADRPRVARSGPLPALESAARLRSGRQANQACRGGIMPFRNRGDSMKILALEKEVPGIPDGACEPYLRAEAVRAWQLYQNGIVRELYFRSDWPGAVLVLECSDVAAAEKALATLPLGKQGLVQFELIPLRAYPGFERLFG